MSLSLDPKHYNVNCLDIGHGVGFSDDLDLSEDDENTIYQLFFNSVFLEIYDNDESQEIEFSYSENWN